MSVSGQKNHVCFFLSDSNKWEVWVCLAINSKENARFPTQRVVKMGPLVVPCRLEPPNVGE